MKTRQMNVEPLPASVLLGLVRRWRCWMLCVVAKLVEQWMHKSAARVILEVQKMEENQAVVSAAGWGSSPESTLAPTVEYRTASPLRTHIELGVQSIASRGGQGLEHLAYAWQLSLELARMPSVRPSNNTAERQSQPSHMGGSQS